MGSIKLLTRAEKLRRKAIFMKQRNWKKWAKGAVIRAAKTFAQTAISMITVGYGFKDIEWGSVLSVSGVAAVVSLLTSLAGIPEENMEE